MDLLLAYVRSLDHVGLTALLRRRPEVCAEPEPRDLRDVATRLTNPYGTVAAVAALDRAGLEVLEAVEALSDAATRGALLGLLDSGDESDDTKRLLDRTLASLREAALVLADPNGVLRFFVEDPPWLAPLGLGPRLDEVLPLLRADGVKLIASRIGVVAPPRKADAVAAVLGRLRDPDAVRSLLRDAPPGTRHLLEVTARDGPEFVEEGRWSSSAFRERRVGPVAWSAERGLLYQVAWDTWVMPAEIALALRGPGYRAPFTPPPPPPATTPVTHAQVTDATTAAAAGALTAVDQLLSFCARTTVRTVKAGTVGTREVRRAAKALRMPETDAAFWFRLCTDAGLLAGADGRATLTGAAEDWRSAVPPDQLVTLAGGWWDAPADGVPRSDAELVLAAAAEIPDGHAVRDVDALADVLGWRAPLPRRTAEETRARTRTAWRGAELLGAVAAGAVAPLGRALLDGRPGALEEAARGVAPRPVGVATFQSDLTATVAGVPAPKLSRLLDGVAEPESRGTASVWRFTPRSVRAALDAGASADQLLADLAAAASTALPQPVTYLVRDVARRHGAVRVTPVASCLRSDDAALLAEIAASRTLAPLRLRSLAPTVLASGATVDEVLGALRAAGYAPVAESADGTVEVTRPADRRTTPARMSRRRTPPAAPDVAALATRLLAGRPGPAAPPPTPSLARIGALTPHLHPDERRVLAHAVDRGVPVRIDYVSTTGRATTRIVEAATVTGPYLSAWCTLREGDRVFTLSRIRSVSPA